MKSSLHATGLMILTGLLMAGMSGCSTPPDRADVYTASDVGQPMSVSIGEVLALRQVKIRIDNRSGVGETAGAVIGGVVGSGVSDNTRASVVGAVLGALAGGTLGRAIESSTTTVPGWEITYRDEATGQTQVMVQPMKGLENLRPGQRIRIIQNYNGVRISPL